MKNIHKIQGWKIAKQRGRQKNRVPPFAPSKNELNFYKKYIVKITKTKALPRRALILGATPELRDLAIKFGLESHSVDISKEMMEKFSSLMKFSGHPKDKRLIKNWLQMKYPKNYFGIIMGDASLNNLATCADNDILFEICSRILGDGGFLVLRQIVYPSKFKPYKNLKRFINDYRLKKIAWEDFFTELRIFIFKEKIYNKKTFQYDAGKNFKLIDELFKNKIITANEYNRINIFRNKVINTFYPRINFIKAAEKKKFKILKEFHDNQFRLFNYMYMMAFKKTYFQGRRFDRS